MLRTRFVRPTITFAAAIAVLGCGDSTGPARLAPVYKLVDVAGMPVPAIVHLSGDPEGLRNGVRLVGRFIEFGPQNQVLYGEADQAITIANGGADTLINIASCFRTVGTFTRQGNLVILQFGAPSMPGARFDTLRLEGRQLVDSIPTDVGTRAPIRYSPGEPAAPICPV